MQSSEAEKALIDRELKVVQMIADEDLNFFFARIDKLLNTVKSVGIVKEEQDVRIVTRTLRNEYDLEKRANLTDPELCCFEVERIVQSS